MLIIQLDPPAPYTVSLRGVPSQEVLAIVREVVGVLLQVTLNTLGVEGAMEAVRQHRFEAFSIIVEVDCPPPLAVQNPDIVQDFFNFMEKVGYLVLPILIILK